MRLIDADALKKEFPKDTDWEYPTNTNEYVCEKIDEQSTVQPERKTGHWILDRSGAYCCDNCMEPCAGYVMMRPRDKYCKMCGAKMEGERKE